MAKEKIIITILITGLIGLYSLDRGRLGHSIPDEKRYIQSTKEMVETGDYITPRYHGKLRFQKPILFYWLIALSYKIFGVGIYGARFPSIIASVLNVILAYLLGRDLFGKKVGIFTAIILSTSEIYFEYSRFAAPDITFILFITAAIYLFIKAYRGDIKGNFKYVYMYIPMAFAMLTKGPLGFFYPMAVVYLFAIFRKERTLFKEFNFLLGILIFLAISAPWFIAMIFLHGNEYFDNVWTLEIIKKLKYVSSGQHDGIVVHYAKTVFYYLGMVFVRHLPWSLFLPASFISIKGLTLEGARPKNTIKLSESKYMTGFSLIMIWFLTVFISLVLIWSKESYYVLSLSVPLSLFMGVYFSYLTFENSLINNLVFKLPYICAIVACFITYILWFVFMVYVLDKPIFSFSLLMSVIPAIMAYAYFSKDKTLIPLSFFAGAFASLAYFSGYIMPMIDQDPLSNVAWEIKRVIKPGDIVGVGSNAVSYHRLNTYLEDYNIMRVDKYYLDKSGENRISRNKRRLINDFLSSADKKVFCVITKEDYYMYVDRKLRDKLNIMYKTFIWKKFHRQNKEYFKTLLSYFLEGKKELLKQALKEEIYLISN